MKEQYIIDYLKNHVQSFPRKEMRGMVLGLLFIMDIFILPFIFLPPVLFIHRVFLLPVIVLFHLWGIFVFFRVEKAQFLFFNGLGLLFLSISLFIVAQKFIYTFSGIQSPWYFVGSLTVYILVFTLGVRVYVQNIYQGRYYRKENHIPKGIVSLIVGAGATGMFIGRLTVHSRTQHQIHTVLFFIYVFISLVFIFSIKMIYQYYLLKRYGHLVEIVPEFKLRDSD